VSAKEIEFLQALLKIAQLVIHPDRIIDGTRAHNALIDVEKKDFGRI
jgi:hypothetical protein